MRQNGFHALDITLDQAGPGQVGAQQRTFEHHLDGQRGQPSAQHDVATSTPQVRQHSLDEVGRMLRVATRQGVPDRFLGKAVRGIPLAGGPVEERNPLGSLGRESRAKRVGEEVVVAVPVAVVVERDDEHVGAVQRLEQCCTVVAAGEAVAQLAGQLLQDGGLEQEPTRGLGLRTQDLVDEVVEDEPVAAGEVGDEGSGVVRSRAARDRQAGAR